MRKSEMKKPVVSNNSYKRNSRYKKAATPAIPTSLEDEKKKGNIPYVFDNGKTTVYAEKGADRDELYQRFIVRKLKVN